MSHTPKDIISSVSDDALWEFYALSVKELRKRGLIRSGNIVGERGEQLAISTYNSIPNEHKLQAAPKGTRNIDAISRKGERFSIKTVKGSTRSTGTFWGMQSPNSEIKDEKKFEYVIVVFLDEDMKLTKILEADWDTFLKFKRWDSRMNAWKLYLSKEFETTARTVFKRSDNFLKN